MFVYYLPVHLLYGFRRSFASFVGPHGLSMRRTNLYIAERTCSRFKTAVAATATKKRIHLSTTRRPYLRRWRPIATWLLHNARVENTLQKDKTKNSRKKRGREYSVHHTQTTHAIQLRSVLFRLMTMIAELCCSSIRRDYWLLLSFLCLSQLEKLNK